MAARILALLGIAMGAGAQASQADAAEKKPRHPRAHYQWCLKKHPSYRARDNTYVGENGKRVACVSPYK